MRSEKHCSAHSQAFVQRLGLKWVRAIVVGRNSRTRLYHVHYTPLYRAIGEADNRFWRRPTIEQALERLLALDGVLMGPSLTWLRTAREMKRSGGCLTAGCTRCRSG